MNTSQIGIGLVKADYLAQVQLELISIVCAHDHRAGEDT